MMRSPLVNAADSLPYRTIDARLIGSFAYKPAKPVVRGSEDRGDSYALLAVASETQNAAPQSPEARVQFGSTQLLLGRWDESVATLEAALRDATKHDETSAAIAASDDASLLTALSAAYRAIGARRDRPRAFLDAAEAAQRAWMLQQSAETAWNRALAIQSLHLRADATDAWRDYLRIDSTSDWADEARAHLGDTTNATAVEQWSTQQPLIERAALRNDAATVARIVEKFPMARLYGEGEYLGKWAMTGEARYLMYARAIGAVLHERGESTLYDTIADFDGGSPMRRAQIQRAVHDYVDGRLALNAQHIAAARLPLQRAYEGLRALRSPFADTARLWLLNCDLYENDNAAVIANSDRWLAEDSFERHRGLATQIWWTRATAFLLLGRPQAAIAEYSRALDVFNAYGEIDNAASMHQLLAEAYSAAGDETEAWRHRFEALARLEQSGSALANLTRMWETCATAALDDGHPAVALLFATRAAAALKVEKEAAPQIVHALLARSKAHRALEDAVAAAADLREARRVAATIEDASIRNFALTAPEVVADRVAQARSAAERQQIIDDALQFNAKSGFVDRVALLRITEAREALRNGHAEMAERALFASAAELERQRTTIENPTLRSSFLAARRSTYDELAALLCRRGDWRTAFDIVERSRARTLLDDVSRHPVITTLPLAAIQQSLANDTAVVEYATVGDRLVAWLIARDRVRFTTLDTSKEAERLVDALRVAIRADDDGAAVAASRRLFDAVVRPWYDEARPFARIVFAADGALARVPFAALQDGRTFLVDRHIISQTPSANVLAACAARDAAIRDANGATLVVAPATSIASAGSEELLTASREEAWTIARQYPQQIVLDGPRATLANFAAQAATARVIHFAGHATQGEESAPRLNFADDAYLHVEDVRALHLPATRVVVLSACSSGSDRSGDTQGVSSLARAFLAAGVPVVVGTLWNVEDSEAARLSAAFHQSLGRGADPTAALRSAQLQLLHSRDARARRLSSWAAFTALGGTERGGSK
ncbi:MAG TPA: CHAT domain-containing protein [Thermoanaerobaculia bacterium]|nr:CHAT domain-containing protein [Thermoanaerobaculia bacterium]